MSQDNLVSSKSTLMTKFLHLWNDLTKPSANLSQQQQARAHMVTTVVLASWIIFTISSSIAFFLIPQLVPGPSVVALFLVFVAYLISKTKYFEVSIVLYNAIILVATLQLLMMRQDSIYGTLIIFAPIMTSLIGRWWYTVVSGIVSIVVFLIFYYFMFNIYTESPILIMVMVGASTTVMALVSWLRERNQMVLERIAQQLRDQVNLTNVAREQAERADRIKSAFLASMSHELRTPLNSIINFTRFVADGDVGPINDRQKELLDEVVNSSKHLLALINDVLDMSKIEAGSLSLFIERDIDITKLLQSVVTTANSLLGNKPVSILTDIQDDLPLIAGDKQRITQILLNIVSNACKFTLDGEIRICAYQDEDEIIISVADTGPGIASEDQELVFQAFKQTQTGLRQGGGTGLGMPIAKSLAEAHGGRLWLESIYGKGSTFYVALPIYLNGESS